MGYGGGSGGSGGGYSTVGGGRAFTDDQELPSYEQAPAGAIRFNTDSNKLEVYIGGPVGYGTLPNGQWMEVDNWSPENQTGGTRGVIALGSTPSGAVQTTNYFNLDTTGNAASFGDLANLARFGMGGCASRTRGYIVGGATPGRRPEIDTLVFSSTGSCTDYGDLSRNSATNSCSSSTRGFALGGSTPSGNSTAIDYFALESTGSGINFGDLINTASGGGGCSSSTRGVYWRSSAPNQIGIEFITMSTLGNAADFGDKTVSRTSLRACSNSVRGVCAGGYDVPGGSAINNIEYITIATLGNAVDFGDMSVNNPGNSQACASSTRGVWSGGTDATMQYIQIMSTGNSIDFGDLTVSATNGAACSNGHGGL